MAKGDMDERSGGAQATSPASDKRKDVKTETVTETNDDGTTVTKTVITTTEEVEDEEPDFGGAFIDEAILKKQEEERAAIQKLIHDSVKLEMEKNKLEDQCQKLQGSLVETKQALDIEKARTKEVQSELANIRKDAKMNGKRRKNFSTVEIDDTENTEVNQDSDNVKHIEDTNEKIRNLQFRLKRLAEDDKAKDVTIEELEKERTRLKLYTCELEKCVPDSKVEKIQKELIDKEKEEEKNKIKIRDRANIINHAGNEDQKPQNQQRSALCVVM